MKKTFTDQLNRQVEINFPSKRIISLVPSQTELLHYLGLENEVTGITKFCIHPNDWFRNKIRVGGTKQLHLDKIKELNPDIIIGNKEENDQTQIEELIKTYPVWMSDVRSLDDALEMIKRVGEMTDKKQAAQSLVAEINHKFSGLKPLNSTFTVAYFIWQQPYMVVSGDTFIHDMMQRCGFKNVFENYSDRYPEISMEELSGVKPDIILLSSEPFPFKEKHIQDFKEIFPDSTVMLVDGEMFSWYGSRLLHAIVYFQQLIRQLKR